MPPRRVKKPAAIEQVDAIDVKFPDSTINGDGDDGEAKAPSRPRRLKKNVEDVASSNAIEDVVSSNAVEDEQVKEKETEKAVPKVAKGKAKRTAKKPANGVQLNDIDTPKEIAETNEIDLEQPSTSNGRRGGANAKKIKENNKIDSDQHGSSTSSSRNKAKNSAKPIEEKNTADDVIVKENVNVNVATKRGKGKNELVITPADPSNGVVNDKEMKDDGTTAPTVEPPAKGRGRAAAAASKKSNDVENDKEMEDDGTTAPTVEPPAKGRGRAAAAASKKSNDVENDKEMEDEETTASTIEPPAKGRGRAAAVASKKGNKTDNRKRKIDLKATNQPENDKEETETVMSKTRPKRNAAKSENDGKLHGNAMANDAIEDVTANENVTKPSTSKGPVEQNAKKRKETTSNKKVDNVDKPSTSSSQNKVEKPIVPLNIDEIKLADDIKENINANVTTNRGKGKIETAKKLDIPEIGEEMQENGTTTAIVHIEPEKRRGRAASGPKKDSGADNRKRKIDAKDSTQQDQRAETGTETESDSADVDWKLPVATKRKPKPETKANGGTAAATTAAAKKQNKFESNFSNINFELAENQEWTMKISSWNVAGLRALTQKGGMEFLEYEKPDIFCMQEIKCITENVPEEAKVKGYHTYLNSTPGGHGGVAIYTKIMPYNIEYGLGDEEQDESGRIITAEYMKFFLICVYVPNAGRKLVNLDKRMRWDELFQQHLLKLDKTKPVIVCGDLNVAHNEIDIANPKSNKRSAGFTQEERDGMTKMLSLGFVDTFRTMYPDESKAYTYWTYMANSRAKNVGWRLDYFIASERIMSKVADNKIRSEVYGSDHCPITLFLNI